MRGWDSCMLHSGENHSANFPFGHSVLVMISLCHSQVPTTDEMQDACTCEEREQNEESRQARNSESVWYCVYFCGRLILS